MRIHQDQQEVRGLGTRNFVAEPNLGKSVLPTWGQIEQERRGYGRALGLEV
jgi:hypothetical protein